MGKTYTQATQKAVVNQLIMFGYNDASWVNGKLHYSYDNVKGRDPIANDYFYLDFKNGEFVGVATREFYDFNQMQLMLKESVIVLHQMQALNTILKG